MTESLKRHLPVIIVVCLVGAATAAFALMQVRNSVDEMDVAMFETLVIVIPCAAMLVCSAVVAMTAHTIERSLYVTMLAICFVLGLVSMVATSMWESDSAVTAALLANSAEDATITAAVNQPLIVMRNIAAYIVMPTLGCIAGAWLGSRMHPMQAEAPKGKPQAKKAGKTKKKR